MLPSHHPLHADSVGGITTHQLTTPSSSSSSLSPFLTEYSPSFLIFKNTSNSSSLDLLQESHLGVNTSINLNTSESLKVSQLGVRGRTPPSPSPSSTPSSSQARPSVAAQFRPLLPSPAPLEASSASRSPSSPHAASESSSSPQSSSSPKSSSLPHPTTVSPHAEFSAHRVITPQLLHGRTKRHLQHTRQQAGGDEHHHDITLGLTIGEEDVLLDLQLNRQLLPRGYFEKQRFRNGSHAIRRPDAQSAGLCHYQGRIRDRPGSWAALSTCRGISGVVFDGKESHYVERVPSSPPTVTSPHYVMQHQHLLPRNMSCGYSGRPHPALDLFKDENFTRLLRYKRSSPNSLNEGSNGPGGPLRGPYNSNPLSRYVELVLVADHLEYKNQGEDLEKIHGRFKDIANIANALYQPLNIFIALVGVEVWQEEDQVVISQDGDQTLTNFLNYRKVRLIPEHPNDNAQLLTGQVFDSGVVGKALKGPICTYQYSGGVNMDHSASVGLVATTVAHEMGHNFGMEHDTEDECQCPDSRCIMAPSSGSRSPSHWSSCSHEYLALSFERSMDYCLRNKPTSLFDSPVCGNSFVEPGEQCDCGLPQHCTNPCCDPKTCMLYTNATCATGHCCDLETCRPKTAGTECRPAHRECDLPEYCLGDSEYCPDDVFKEDGHECLAGKAYCHNGMCRTHEQQCQLLWGPTGQNSHDKCYSLNTQGNNNGNCGYNWANDTYYKCSTINRKCGMMHCRHFNERLEFGMESVSKVAHRFIQGDQHEIIPCRVAQVDLGLDMVDPGLAPDGAKCGYQRMCVNQACMAVASLRKEGCDCNGNGACNNKGHCHCTLGFAPPDCNYPGLGGSIDSGPAANPNATNKFVVGLFVFFLGVVPLVVAALCLVYYVRGNLGLLGIWLTKKGLPGTTRLPTSDSGGGRTGGGAAGLCGIEAGNGVAGGLRSPPSPPSSRGSKSNSPLLNGAATLISSPIPVAGANGVAPGGPTFFGKHEGFTISPINTSNKGPVSNGVMPGVHDNSSNGSANTLVLNSINAKKNSSVPPQPMRQAPVAPPAAATGGKMIISGPSLKNTTNRSVLPSSTHASSLPPGVPKTLPPPPPPTSAPFSNHGVPPVAIVNPLRRPVVSNGHHPRPQSVPDHNSVLVGRVAPSPPASATVSPSNSASSKSSSTVARLASFLSKKEKSGEVTSDDDHDSSRSNTLPRKAAKINRESLMQLEISAPMQLQATKLPDNLVPVRPAPVPPSEPNLKPSEVKLTQSYDDKGRFNGVARSSIAEVGGKSSKVTWAPSVDIEAKGSSTGNSDLQRIGSLREQPVTMRPPIPKFGSMRAPRPKSLPPARPSEPPPRPPLPTIPSPGSDEFYDACVEDIDVPTASNEDPSSPTESIYATIEEETPPEQSIGGSAPPPVDEGLLEDSEHEPFYANSDAAEQQRQEQKPPKKSVFSFLYAKTKRKKKEEDSVAEEPLYCNIAEAAESDGGGEAESGGAPRSPSRSSSLSPADRTSCGSSEDGGLLSEIVSELVTREPEFKNALSKKKRPGFIIRKDSQDKSKSSSAVQDATASSNGPHAEPHRDVPSLSVVETEGPSTLLSKSTSYPWKSNPSSSASLTSSVSSSNDSQKPLSYKPRGVFAYLKRNMAEDNQVTKIEDTGAAPETASADIKCPIRAVSNTTITTQIVTDPSSGPSSGTNKPAVQSKEEASKSLQSSLAAVRAASLQLNYNSQLLSPSITQQLPSSNSPVPLYTNVPNPNTKNSFTEQSDISARRSSDTTSPPVLPVKLNSRKNTFNTKQVESDSNPSKGLLTTTKAVDAGASTPNTSQVITSRAGVAPLRSIPLDKTTGVAASVNSAVNKIGTDKGNRLTFPPDKVLFPPDKSSVPDSKPARKEPSSNVGSSILRGGPRNSGGKSKALTNKTKATSPGSSTSLASKSSEGSVKSVASTKPGRVLSPTRSVAASSAPKPLSSSDKSKSTTSSASRQQDKTSASFRTKSPTPSTNTNGGDSSKEVKKSSSVGSSGAGGAAAARSSGRRTPATANAPRSSTTAFAGKAVGSSNVASLQQRFEKEATDGNTDTKADNTRPSTAGRSVSRRTSDTKPSVTTKPRV